MALTTGLKLGPYEIVAAIGAGGMGEVYRAKDTRLDRTVAIKVLPSHLSQNSDLKQRFEREARAISSLSHAHICSLFDIGSHEGTDYLVMEYLEGETLAQRLTRGAVPAEQVLRYGMDSRGNLVSHAFDTKRMQLSGSAITVSEEPANNFAATASGAFSVSDNDLVVYRAGGIDLRTLAWVDRGGTKLDTIDQPSIYDQPYLSGDDRHMVFGAQERSDVPAGRHYDSLRGHDLSILVSSPVGAAFPITVIQNWTVLLKK